jgi:hypothetical protein
MLSVVNCHSRCVDSFSPGYTPGRGRAPSDSHRPNKNFTLPGHYGETFGFVVNVLSA